MLGSKLIIDEFSGGSLQSLRYSKLGGLGPERSGKKMFSAPKVKFDLVNAVCSLSFASVAGELEADCLVFMTED